MITRILLFDIEENSNQYIKSLNKVTITLSERYSLFEISEKHENPKHLINFIIVKFFKYLIYMRYQIYYATKDI